MGLMPNFLIAPSPGCALRWVAGGHLDEFGWTPEELALVRATKAISYEPIVAAVACDCIGSGLELLLSTDIRAAVPEAGIGLPEVKWAIYRFGSRVPHRYGRESRRTGRMVTALGRSCADAGGGRVFSRALWPSASSAPR